MLMAPLYDNMLEHQSRCRACDPADKQAHREGPCGVDGKSRGRVLAPDARPHPDDLCRQQRPARARPPALWLLRSGRKGLLCGLLRSGRKGLLCALARVAQGAGQAALYQGDGKPDTSQLTAARQKHRARLADLVVARLIQKHVPRDLVFKAHHSRPIKST